MEAVAPQSIEPSSLNPNEAGSDRVVNLSNKIVQESRGENENATGPSEAPLMSLSASTVSSATPSRSANFTTAGSHNWKSPQLLHKRISGHLKLKAVPSNEFIMNKTLDDMAVSCNIPQWLIYSWTSKARDKNLVDRKTQQAIAELLILKQYALPLALCLSLSSSQQDAAAKNFLLVFRHINKVMTRSTQSTPSLALGESTPNSATNSPTTAPKSSLNLNVNPDKPIAAPISNRRRDHLIGFLEALIIEEVTEAKTESTLFRSNNIVSKILSSYASFVGKEFLHHSLCDVINKIINMGSMEVDPAKLDPPAPGTTIDSNAVVAENMKKLLTATKEVLSVIIATAEKCPSGLKKLCFLIQKQVEQKFRKSTNFTSQLKVSNITVETMASKSDAKERQVAVSGFIFLRYICPSIVSADIFGLVSSPLKPIQRRNLILISKIIQNIANGVKFGSKEGYMIPANQFVEENEPDVAKYCDSIQMIDPDTVYHSEYDGELSNKPPAEFDTALLQTMQSFNAQMDKMIERLQKINVNEIMTYTVFGALKCVLKRFESIEKQIDAGITAEQKANIAQKSLISFNERDNELLDNVVLLGGLEEILLMNNCVLIYGLLSPTSFYDSATDGSMDPFLISKYGDALARSTIQVIGPHGGSKLFEICEWVINQEAKLRQKLDTEKTARPMIFQGILGVYDLLHGEPEEKEEKKGTVLAHKLVSSFFVAFARDFLRPILNDFYQEVQDSKVRYEIDPVYLNGEDNLKTNLDTLLGLTMKLFTKIIDGVKELPEGMIRMIKYLFKELSSSGESDEFNASHVGSANYLVCFLFLKIYCPMIANPAIYNIHIDVDLKQGESKAQLPGVPDRLFVLSSYMLRFICCHVITGGSGSDHSVNMSPYSTTDSIANDPESLSYEKQMMAPFVEQWNLGVKTFIQDILKSTLTNFATISGNALNVAELTGSGSSVEKSKLKSLDPPISVSTTSRAKGIMTFRKLLTEGNIRRLKQIISTSEFKETSKNANIHDMFRKNLHITEPPKDELHGLRVETIHYKLLDRIRIVFLSIYKDQDVPPPRSEQRPANVTITKLSQNDLKNASEKPAARPKSGGKKDPKTPSSPVQSATNVTKISIAQATKNMVRNIFSRGSHQATTAELVDTETFSRRGSKKQSEKPIDAQDDRGLMGILRANRPKENLTKQKIAESLSSGEEIPEKTADGKVSSALVDFEWEENGEQN